MSILKSAMTLSVLLTFGCAPGNKNESERIAKLHNDATVIDTHSDFLDRSAIDGSGLNDDIPGAQTTVKKLLEGQVDAQFFSVCNWVANKQETINII